MVFDGHIGHSGKKVKCIGRIFDGQSIMDLSRNKSNFLSNELANKMFNT